MAYNNFYPNYYQQYQQPQQQIQNSGFVSVRNINEALNYPVAPGNSITFKDENNPFVYTKTRGFSPLEQPVFEQYRLVKVENKPAEQPETANNGFDAHEQIKLLWDEINSLKQQIRGNNDEPADDNTVHAVREKSRSVYE